MEKITVLSPHLDDSTFSLGLTLACWGASSVQLWVLNFFTRSAYAPHSSAQTIDEISAVREEEDRQALAFVHVGIEVMFIGLLDAPLRLNLPFSQITQESSAARISPDEIRLLSQHIHKYCADSLVIAPLGLGNHVDHIAVQQAALCSLPPQDLAFYEDLPYISWTSTTELQSRIQAIEHRTKIALEPSVWRYRDAVRKKRQIAGFYRSQITEEEADRIAGYANTYNSGERLWLPADGQRWKAMERLATEPPQTAIPDQSRPITE